MEVSDIKNELATSKTDVELVSTDQGILVFKELKTRGSAARFRILMNL